MGGFGHLVVQGESDDALGVVYDSDVFPDQVPNAKYQCTCNTVIAGNHCVFATNTRY
jgi:hypothetical protein